LVAEPVPNFPSAQTPLTQAFVAAHAPIDEQSEESILQKQDLLALKERVEKEAYAAGLRKGELAAQAELAERIESLVKLAKELGEARKAVLSTAQDEIVEVIYETCCKILGEKAVLPETVTQMVQGKLADLIERVNLTVHLHPQDLATLKQDVFPSELTADLRWQSDETIRLGGCIVEGTSGTLDARLETQLVRLKDALMLARNTIDGKKDK
jgi:flagellar assembly protein FliH